MGQHGGDIYSEEIHQSAGHAGRGPAGGDGGS